MPGILANRLFALKGSYDVADNGRVRFAVNKLFNRAPPPPAYNPSASKTSACDISGGSYNANFYHTKGWTFSPGVNAKF